MVIVLSDDALRRIEADEHERLARLAREGTQLTTERDWMTSGWIVHDPDHPGIVQLVSERGSCTCRRFELWNRCPHAAVVRHRDGITRR